MRIAARRKPINGGRFNVVASSFEDASLRDAAQDEV
jgi:hypothetical protein